MMPNSPEKSALWTRLCAEADGWTSVRKCPHSDCACYHTDIQDSERLVGKPPDDEIDDWHIESYSSDLNALARVARKVCETGEGRQLLRIELHAAWVECSDPLFRDSTMDDQLLWLVFLPAEELFEILGKVLEQLKEAK